MGKIDLDSRGLVTVFLFGGSDLDTGEVDVDSLRFGPPEVVDDRDGARPEHGGHAGGGAPLILHFRVGEADFESDDDVAKLVGETSDGTLFSGTEEVDVRSSDDEDEDENDGEDREERNEERSDTNDSTDDGDENGNRGRGRGHGRGRGN